MMIPVCSIRAKCPGGRQIPAVPYQFAVFGSWSPSMDTDVGAVALDDRHRTGRVWPSVHNNGTAIRAHRHHQESWFPSAKSLSRSVSPPVCNLHRGAICHHHSPHPWYTSPLTVIVINFCFATNFVNLAWPVFIKRIIRLRLTCLWGVSDNHFRQLTKN